MKTIMKTIMKENSCFLPFKILRFIEDYCANATSAHFNGASSSSTFSYSSSSSASTLLPVPTDRPTIAPADGRYGRFL